MKISGMDLQVYTLPVITANMYVLVSDESALVIDPQVNKQALEYLEEKGVKEIKVILTHEHFDHISGVNALRDYADSNNGTCTVYAGAYCADAIPYPQRNLSKYFEAIFISKAEDERRLAEEIFERNYHCEADIVVNDGYELVWKCLKLIFRETPGHSPGSICIELYDDKDDIAALSTGDSLVQGNKVITRLPLGSKKDYAEITRPYLESFDPDTWVLPGHGRVSLMRDLELG